MPSLHQRRTHPTYVEGCFGCKAGTLTTAAVSGPVSELAQRERVLAQDMDAYKRMRRQGLQPGHLAGSATVEREARNPLEIRHPRIIGMNEEARQHAQNAVDVAATIEPSLSRFGDT
jgi:hypothetical protein